jgi:hypothetical protein
MARRLEVLDTSTQQLVYAAYPFDPQSDGAPGNRGTRMRNTGMGWRSYLDRVKQSRVAWVEDRAPTMGTALAFYSAFSLAPLLIIVIAVAGAVFRLMPRAGRSSVRSPIWSERPLRRQFSHC